MLFLLLVLNFAISILNAWTCGRAWPETRHYGGMPHFMNWMGAIMSACGFTWCYLIILAVVGANIPIDTNPDTHQAIMAIQPDTMKAMLELGYVVIIGSILGSGLAITMNTWAYALRERSFRSAGLAGYNTFAQAYNTYEAVSVLPSVFSDLGGFFGSAKGGGDRKNTAAVLIVVALVAIALLAGVLTTYVILSFAASMHASDMRAETRYRQAA
jgi:hypothetical protein